MFDCLIHHFFHTFFSCQRCWIQSLREWIHVNPYHMLSCFRTHRIGCQIRSPFWRCSASPVPDKVCYVWKTGSAQSHQLIPRSCPKINFWKIHRGTKDQLGMNWSFEGCVPIDSLRSDRGWFFQDGDVFHQKHRKFLWLRWSLWARAAAASHQSFLWSGPWAFYRP